jgi:hypothetical protein
MKKPTPGRHQDFPDTEPLPREEAASYEDTQPQPLGEVRKPALSLDTLSLAPVEVSLYEAMALARRNNRVCPQPSRWLELYRVLQDSAPGAPRPPEPLVGSAWASTPPLAKRMSFEQQLEWADKNKALQAAYEFLQGLRDNDWYEA